VLLSAAMIVRDEERHLNACLTSLEGVVDEVTVVDTGSTDRSVEIALAHGARVRSTAWTGDFARARNLALEEARGRWILYIDADERLQPVRRESVEALLGAGDEIGFRLLLHPFPDWTAYREYRLWRNDPRIRFEGVIHEKVRPAILRAARDDDRRVGDCDLRLEHRGYLGDQASKHRRNLPLLRAELAARPDTIFNWRHLGVALAALGEPTEAERALERAVTLARAAPRDDVHGSLAYAELVRLRHRRGDDVEGLLDEGLERWPENWLLVWIRARVEMAAGCYERAMIHLDRLRQADVDALAELGIAYDRRLFGVFAHAARGRCLLALDRPAEAAEAYAAAERCEPDTAEHAVKRQLAEALARRRARRSCAPSRPESGRAGRQT
jgi:glycosyltransferase involved in cell wall biosynthesis